MRGSIVVCIALAIGLSSRIVLAKECSAKSGVQSTALLELYTSEGCNSCPPADAWVNELEKRGVGRGRVVPLALHVDYWDYIGWKDRFAQPQFTQRQQLISRRNTLNTIFTPQLVLNGVTMRRWGDDSKLATALDLIQSGKPRADIGLSLRETRADRLAIEAGVTLHDPNARTNSALYLAVYENGLSSEVRAGENSGVTLRHNYVVRAWLGPLPVDATAAREIDLSHDWRKQNLGVAAFVEDHDTGAILQALALPLCR